MFYSLLLFSRSFLLISTLIISYNAYFVDLFVRASNSVAINMYKKFGYIIYRRVLGYYSGLEEEDAFGKLFSNEDPL